MISKQIHRIIIGAIAMLLFAPVAQGQLHGFKDRAYTMVGVGPNIYMNDAGEPFDYMGYHGEIMLGMNLFDNIGVRLGGWMAHNKNVENIISNYMAFHVDMTVELFNLIYGYNPNRRYGMKGIVGVGFIRRYANYLQKTDNEIIVMPGLSYSHPLGEGIYLLVETKVPVFLQKFDHNKKISAMAMMSAGVEYRFNDNPYRNGMQKGSSSLRENWFMAINGGINSVRYAGLQPEDQTHLMKPAAELTIGKYMSPVLGARIGIHGLQAATKLNSFNIVNAHFDLMLNVNNMIHVRQYRRLTFSLYLGAGLINRMDTKSMTINANAGLLTRVMVSNSSDVMVDLRYMATTNKFVEDISGQSRTSVGMATAMVGYCYNLSVGSYR